MSSINKCAVALLGLLIMLSPVAQAALLAPGGTVPLTGDALAAQYFADSTAGPILKDTGTVAFTGKDAGGNVVYSGKVRQVVYLAAIGNLACPAGGCLDFYYQFSNDGTSTDSIARMSTANYKGFVTDVGTAAPFDLLAGPGTVPTIDITRSGTGSTIGFDYGVVGVGPGDTALTVGILTNAHFLTSGSTQFLNDGTATVGTWAPTAVPEPGSIVFFGTSLLGLTALFRKRLFSRS